MDNAILYILRRLFTWFFFMLVICVHEFGHAWVGAKVGCTPYSFSVGFGPNLLSWKSKKSNILYHLRTFPVGGFCLFDNPNDVKRAAQMAKEEGKKFKISVESMMDRKLNNLNTVRQMIVYLAGPVFNVLLALLLSFTAYWVLGTGSFVNSIDKLVDNGPAQQSGLMPGDIILSINGKNVGKNNKISDFLQESDGQPLLFEISRKGENEENYSLSVKVAPQLDDAGQSWKIGIYQGHEINHLSLSQYALAAVNDVQWYLGGIFQGICNLAFPDNHAQTEQNEVSGVVGTLSSVSKYASTSTIPVFLMLMSLLSANLAIFNMLPIPGLDGFKAMQAFLEGISGKRWNYKVLTIATAICMCLMLAFMVVLTATDLMKLAGGN